MLFKGRNITVCKKAHVYSLIIYTLKKHWKVCILYETKLSFFIYMYVIFIQNLSFCSVKHALNMKYNIEFFSTL